MATKLDDLKDELPDHVVTGVRHAARVAGQPTLDELTRAIKKAYVDDPEPWLLSAYLLEPDEYDTFEEIVKKAHKHAQNNRPKVRRKRS